MDSQSRFADWNALSTLRWLAQRGSSREQCEFCSHWLESEHRHLLEAATGKLICACTPCALRFENVVGGRWKLVPRSGRALPDFQLTDELWESLALPISLAWFFSQPDGKVKAMYPSPAGPTESLLPLSNWRALVAANPVLDRMQLQIEALLVNRVGAAHDYYIAPIDTCYQLVGLIRLHWRGLSGGDAVWREITRFFSRLESDFTSERGAPVPREPLEPGGPGARLTEKEAAHA